MRFPAPCVLKGEIAPGELIRAPGAVIAALLLLAACASGPSVPSGREPLPAEAAGPEPVSTPAAQGLETRIHQLVNARRTERGLPPLRWDPRIADVARAHSRAMANGRVPFGHQGFEARTTAIRSFLPLVSMAENVAYDSRSGDRLAARVVDDWLASSGHRANIEGEFTETGIGAARAPDGIYYFTQIFVRRAPERSGEE